MADQEWFNDAGRGVQDSPGVPVVAKGKKERRAHAARRFYIALILIAIYGAMNIGCLVGLYLGLSDLTMGITLTANVGTLVGAVVAFYFASSRES